jgi:broad specificity phosphatase PhoE
VTVLLLVRHGSTDALGKRISGRAPGVPLNANGRLEVDRLAARLARAPIAAVYSSPIERCVETAHAIAKSHALGVMLRENLTEVDFGAWTNRELAELDALPAFHEFKAARSRTRPPGGEHALEVQARMVEELERIQKDHADAAVAVVSHGDPLKTALGYYLGIPIDLLHRLELGPASLSVLRLTGEHATLLAFNDLGADAHPF